MQSPIQTNISFSMCDQDIENAVQSYTLSKIYTRKVFQLAVINIIYHRLNIPEEQFEERSICGVKYIVSNKTSEHELIQKYHMSIKGAFEVFEKDKLQSFYLFFKTNNGDLKEYYTFHFHYNIDMEPKNKLEKKVVLQQIKNLFQVLHDLSSFEKWDDKEIQLDVELVYNSPLSFQPRFFTNTTSLTHLVLQDLYQQRKRFKLNCLDTGFHSLKCYFAGENIKPLSRPETPEETDNNDKNSEHSKKSEKISNSDTSDDDEKVSVIQNCPEFCICQTSVTDESLELRYCASCKKLYHCACFGFLETQTIPKLFKCFDCGGDANLPNGRDISCVGFFRLRLLLCFCYLTMELPDIILCKFPQNERDQLWKNLEELDIIIKRSKKLKINKRKIKDKQFLKQFFSLKETDSEDEPLVKRKKV